MSVAIGAEHPILGEVAAAELVETAGAKIAEAWSEYLGPDQIADHAQDSYEKLLAKHCAGEEIEHPKALIKRIAYYHSRDKIIEKHPELVDPEHLAAAAVGEGAEPGEELAWRSDIANIAALVDQLSEEQQAVYRAVFLEHLSVREAASRVGRSKSTVDRIMRELHEQFEGVFSGTGEDGAKLKVLTAYAFGDKSVRRAAEILLKSDPTAPAILRGIRGTHEGAAALVPPVVVGSSSDSGVLQRLADGFGSLRDRVGGADHSGVAEAAGQLGTSGAGRGSGAAVGGGLATITGALGAKGVALCAGGAATVACVAAVVAPGLGPSNENSGRGPEPAQAAAAEVDRHPPEPPRIATTEPEPPAAATSNEPSGQTPSGGGGGEGGGGRGDTPVAPQPRSAPTPANPSSPSDPAAYNPYSPTSPAPAAPAPAPSSTSSGGGSSGGSSSGGCSPYDPAC